MSVHTESAQAQMASVPTAIVDVDAHEMVPSGLWDEVFGGVAGRIAHLIDGYLRSLGDNDFANPDFRGDIEEMTAENVWTVKGTRAPGAVDTSRRLEALDVMGIQRQLVFPGYALFGVLLATGDEDHIRTRMGVSLPLSEIRAIGRQAVEEYNSWAAATTVVGGERLRFVAYLLADGSVDDLVGYARQLIDAGATGLHLPTGVPPADLSPADPELDPFYALLAERNVPLLTHVGGERGFKATTAWGRAPAFKPGKIESAELGLEPYSMATLHYPVSNFITTLVLGGVFERHPTLRMGAIESGAHWFGPLADCLDMWARDVHRTRLKPFISMLPSEYMARNTRVTPYHFEPVDQHLQRYPHLQDCYAYSSDYPHSEGGKHSLRTFHAKLAPLGDATVERFFVTNGELLLPAQRS
jgi:predicted TIM-barrel fold metal-dependent hydrolase